MCIFIRYTAISREQRQECSWYIRKEKGRPDSGDEDNSSHCCPVLILFQTSYFTGHQSLATLLWRIVTLRQLSVLLSPPLSCIHFYFYQFDSAIFSFFLFPLRQTTSSRPCIFYQEFHIYSGPHQSIMCLPVMSYVNIIFLWEYKPL